MSTNRKTSTTAVAGDPTGAQDNPNLLYAAHQVHTLAQIVFQRIASSWPNRAPWTPLASPVFGQPCPMPAFGAGTTAAPPVASAPGSLQAAPPQVLFYWYP